MYKKPAHFNFRPLGQEIKRKREAKGWTQEYLARCIDRTSHTVMYMENRGQHPSLNAFYRTVRLLDISVDQFFFPEKQREYSQRRKRVNALLDSLNEKELAVVESTAEGLKQARDIEIKE